MEVAPFGIKTLLVEPGTFRTDLLTQKNSKSVETKFEDYKSLTGFMASQFENLNGNQAGDPRKGVECVIDVVKGENGTAGKEWPDQLPLGSDAVAAIRKKCEDTLQQLKTWEEFSSKSNII
jgi:hypothetical protein